MKSLVLGTCGDEVISLVLLPEGRFFSFQRPSVLLGLEQAFIIRGPRRAGEWEKKMKILNQKRKSLIIDAKECNCKVTCHVH